MTGTVKFSACKTPSGDCWMKVLYVSFLFLDQPTNFLQERQDWAVNSSLYCGWYYWGVLVYAGLATALKLFMSQRAKFITFWAIIKLDLSNLELSTANIREASCTCTCFYLYGFQSPIWCKTCSIWKKLLQPFRNKSTLSKESTQWWLFTVNNADGLKFKTIYWKQLEMGTPHAVFFFIYTLNTRFIESSLPHT